MKRTSPRTRDLIQELHRSISLWEKLKGSRDDVAVLSEIGDSGEPAAIVDILAFVLATRNDVAAAAAMSVDKLVRKSTTQELIWLDGTLRVNSFYSGDYRYEWHRLSPRQLDSFECFDEASNSLFGLASFHQSGYIREAAIKRLDLITSGVELPFLILRLNDWVSNVRDAAYEAISSRLKPEYARYFIANLPLLSRLEDAGRTDHKPLVQAINRLLQSAECRATLLESLKSEDRFIRRACFRLALNSPDLDLVEVVRRALNDKDTVIRGWAAHRVSSAFKGARLDNFLELMKRDRFMPVRREALRIVVKQNSPAALVELRAALLDSHASMREEAHYHLRKLDQMDVADFYKQHLLTGEDLRVYAAISGLGETGATKDDDLILPYTVHPTNRIRRAAIKAIAKLNRGAHIDLFIEALKDQVPYVSRQAFNALAAKASLISSERIWELFQSAVHPHVKRNALSLIEKLDKWESIYYLVRGVRDPDGGISEMSRFGIQRWLARINRSFLSPSAEQVERLSNALKECGSMVDEKTQAQLRFSMRGFG